MTDLDQRHVDAVIVKRFGDDWDPFTGIQQFHLKEAAVAPLAAATTLGWEPPSRGGACVYTHSHTREWCGDPYCREN